MWLYSGKEFTSTDIGDHVGFVYVLTARIKGKKHCFSTKTLPPLKGTKRKCKRVTKSDWRSYCSSSPVFKALAEEHDIERLQREIVHCCRTKSEMSYHETRLQFVNDVLLRDDWHNEMVMCRIASKHLKGVSATTSLSGL